MLTCSLPRRDTISRTPGRLVLPTWSAAKLIRSTSVPESIHSAPVCQPSTVGGFIRSCPMYRMVLASGCRPSFGDVKSCTRRIVPITTSVGLFTFSNRAFLKKSELNMTRSMAVRL